MSVVDGGDRFFPARLLGAGALIAFFLSSVAPVQAEPAISPSSSEMPPTLDGEHTMEELRDHASTIADILDAASKRVDQLAADDVTSQALMEAIRQELSLSRRWNHHLGTILNDVTEARRALGAREREAAKEITRLTAAAEEARQELMALKRVLKGAPAENDQQREIRSEDSTDSEISGDLGHRSGLQLPAPRAGAEGDNEIGEPVEDRTLSDLRATLMTMQKSQKSAARDVDAVRAKIIEALRKLNLVQGDLPMPSHPDGASLSSEDITAWAASMAVKLGQAGQIDAR